MLGRMFQCCLFLVAAVWAVGCGGGSDDASERLSQVGETCSKTGDCDSGLVCLGAVCQQEGAACPDDKECSGLECGGPDPVCGTSCGTCEGDQSCKDGECVACEASCEGKECGDDGCGGSCGTCVAPKTCHAAQCKCAPSCAGKQCGDDGCGGNCGSCTAPKPCQNGQCKCPPSCAGKQCGDDGCGGSCGTCGANGVCQAGKCVCPSPHKPCFGLCCDLYLVCNVDTGTCCKPSCTGKQCGDDGCEGSCGTCNGDQTCESGQCVGGSSCEPNCGTPEGLKWVSIPGGTFEMGCSPNDDDCDGDENPPHSVTVSGFEILETEVTEAQYEAAMDGNPSCNYGGGGGADNPVECVDWFNAKTFCEAIGGRLPTEAEWEFAARGGTTTRYYCGDAPECLSNIAWYSDNWSGMKHSVKKKEPNAYGLYDMLGNVWEWTNDWYDEGYYESSPSSNPQGPDSGSYRVGRGGSFGNSDDYFLRVSNRSGDYPSGDDGLLGVRCARSVEP